MNYNITSRVMSGVSEGRRLGLTLIVLPRMLAPFMLSTANTVLRWSSYMTKPNPRVLPVSLSRGRLISTISPHLRRREHE
jgi:hypothetical protein